MMSAGKTTEDEILAGLKEGVAAGLVEEVSPGNFSLTAAGKAHVARMLADRPEAREFLDQVRRRIPINDNRGDGDG
jgi:hypothetical protein